MTSNHCETYKYYERLNYVRLRACECASVYVCGIGAGDRVLSPDNSSVNLRGASC